MRAVNINPVSTILDKIVAAKREEVARLKRETPESSLRRQN